jgi:hypothetical protein
MSVLANLMLFINETWQWRPSSCSHSFVQRAYSVVYITGCVPIDSHLLHLVEFLAHLCYGWKWEAYSLFQCISWSCFWTTPQTLVKWMVHGSSATTCTKKRTLVHLSCVEYRQLYPFRMDSNVYLALCRDGIMLLSWVLTSWRSCPLVV